MTARPAPLLRVAALAALATLVSAGFPVAPSATEGSYGTPRAAAMASGYVTDGSAVGNFSDALSRLVTLVGVAGGALLSIVWVRVALSWFSNDVTKKVQAKDRARDALVGTLLFAAALSGLLWGLARWVLTGS